MLIAKRLSLFGFLVSLGVFVSGFVLEYWYDLMPCLLCHTQRATFIILGMIFFIGLVQKKLSNKLLGLFATLFSIFGMVVSGWQVYLQNKPADENGICLPSLSFVWETGSFSDVIHAVIHGTGGECSQVVWKMFGLSMAAWSLLLFSALLVLSFFYITSRHPE